MRQLIILIKCVINIKKWLYIKLLFLDRLYLLIRFFGWESFKRNHWSAYESDKNLQDYF